APTLQPPPVPARLRDFCVIGTLGTGTFGRVLLVRDRLHDRLFALKCLNKSHLLRMRQVEHVTSERDILLHTKHPFIVGLHATYQDSRCIYLLMDFVVGGEVFTYLRRAKRFPLEVAKFYLASIVLVLAHLHGSDIVYRDLKPENILLDQQGYVKVTDFGFAKQLGGGSDTNTTKNGAHSSRDGNANRTFTLCGTPDFLSPESVRGTGHGKASDWWQLGVLAFELLVGYPPFCGTTPYSTYENILAASPETIPFPESGPLAGEGGASARDLIRSLLTPDLTKRLGNLAGGAQDIMRHPFFRGVDWDALLRREVRAPIVP
ncbi:kinase-like protein, partial [Jaminaea rosea]